MNSTQLLTGPLAQSIGWALLHLLWQAAIVAGILAAVLALLPRRAANARYLASCTALALVFGMFISTAVANYDPAAQPIVTTTSINGAASPTTTVSLAEVPVLIAATAAASWRDRALDAVGTARQSLPSIVAIWFAGVVLLSSRLLLTWIRARRLVKRGTRKASIEWERAAARISEALGLRRAVRLLESAAVEVPSVLGSLRPIILLPASTLTGLTPEQIEMVLAHELAHIRRHDFLVNLLQAFVETLMFYHPAVWWMSHRVRIERENCCDDLAVAVCGNPLQYARALTRLEELRADALSIVVAANGGSLLDRVRRIAGARAESTGNSPRWAAALVMLVILGLAVVVPSLPALAQRDDDSPPTTEAKTAEATTEVAEAEEADDPSDRTDEATSEAPDVEVRPVAGEHVEIQPTPTPSAAPMAPHAGTYITPTPPPTPRSMPRVAAQPTPRPTMTPVAMASMDLDVIDDDDEREKSSTSSGKLSVDDLISLRAVGVTGEYIKSMRALFPGVSLKQITNLRAVGVTPEYVREMRAAGYEVRTSREASNMAAVGVTSAYAREMRAAGFDAKTANEISNMRAVGVTPEYVREMRAAGLDVRSSREISDLRAVGVTAEYVRSIREAGVNLKTPREASNLAAVGVTPEFVRKLAAAGYANLSVRELSNLAANGINDDFIREMEKYRDKN